MTKKIMIVGVGGQGTLLASRILGNTVINEGFDVKVSEVHGMSQRGGSVVTYVKYGEKVYSPIIGKGEADIILAFEMLEAYRAMPYLKEGGKLIVNGDEPLLACLPNAIKCGIDNPQNQVYAYNIEQDGLDTVFDVCLFGQHFNTRIGAIGRHMVYDALFAFAAGHFAGLSVEQMRSSLEDFSTVGDRQRIVETDGVRVIADCYNASPESVSAALDVLKGFAGRKIAVLGDMLELGEHSPALHAKTGGKAKETGVDLLVCVGEQSKNTAFAFGENSVCFGAEEGEKAAEYIKNTVSAGDTVLFKGSRGMKLETIMKKVFNI